jgi:hypothetical protein
MEAEKLKFGSIFKIAFLLAFILLAVFHITGLLRLDIVALVLIVIAVIPFLLPYLSDKTKSIEAFSVKTEILEKKVRIQDEEIKKQQKIIHQIVVYSMAYYLYDILRIFDECQRGVRKEFKFKKTDEHSLRFLRDNGYIEQTFKIASLTEGENLADKVKLTPIGKFYIELRKSFHPNE